DINVISDVSQVFNIIQNNEYFIFLHHLDSEEDYLKTTTLLQENFLDFSLIALRNTTNNIEGCSVLKKGYKAYINSISNFKIIQDAIDAVKNGNIWVYPELMQFLISSVPLNDPQQNKLLNTISVKELEILELVAQGLSNTKIAQMLNLAEVTVKKHISALFKKLNVKDRLSLALFFHHHSK
ncbi:MAG: response regulator transcription factor, partial [Campylobacterota bacterium]|nr:response regulator transcription factor [Campylobacterota bacterium]